MKENEITVICVREEEYVMVSIEKNNALKPLQELVGGWIERIPHIVYQGKRRYECYVNEEGILMNLPINIQASIIAGQPIFGNMVMVLEGDLE